MLCGCIDIGTNTTRVLVADVGADGIREVLQRKAFTRLGRGLEPDGAVSPAKIAEVAGVVAEQAAVARAAGARALRVVATAAVREAPNREAVCAALRAAGVGDVAVLSGAEEAAFAFLGATSTLAAPLEGPVGVVDVGGGSTEIAVGTTREGAGWWASRRIGSGSLREPGASPLDRAALERMRARAEAALADVAPPPVAHALAVGGSAASLRRVVGPVLDAAALERALGELCTGTPEVVAGSCCSTRRPGGSAGRSASDAAACAKACCCGSRVRGDPMTKAAEIAVDPDEPFAVAAARVVRARAEELMAGAEGVLDVEDPERVHDMRVASRRLRAALEGFAPCFPRAAFDVALTGVKALADALGERRDPDVHVAALEGFAAEVDPALGPGIGILADRTRRARAGGNERLAEALGIAVEEDLRGRLLALADAAEEIG
jgi:exopolyphosphatase/guanosine-5'-triphosphate,3'-diphosphate pyrophosphatase